MPNMNLPGIAVCHCHLSLSLSFDMCCDAVLRKPAQSGETRIIWLAKGFTGSSDIPCELDHQNVLGWL